MDWRHKIIHSKLISSKLKIQITIDSIETNKLLHLLLVLTNMHLTRFCFYVIWIA